jgi:putative tricarboxylic transport membrane protein
MRASNRSALLGFAGWVISLACVVSAPIAQAQSWQPSKTVEFIVPAGTGGGADQMARLIDAIIKKHKLMSGNMVVVNKGGGAGAEGFLEVKAAKGDPHKIIITLSNLFTTPLATGVPFNWRDLTPVAMMALDQFVLWVNAESPYRTTKEFIESAKKAGPGKMKMAGTGARQEDQIITVAIEKSLGIKMTYVPFKGGGDVAVQLVGKHVDSTVNNPIEAVAHWRGGKLRPLCVFDGARLTYHAKITKSQAWSDIPTCKDSGLDVEYVMLRGIFTAAGVPDAAVKYYVDVMQKVRATPDWKEFMEQGAFNQTFMVGDEYQAWVSKEELRHQRLMKEAGFLAPGAK